MTLRRTFKSFQRVKAGVATLTASKRNEADSCTELPSGEQLSGVVDDRDVLSDAPGIERAAEWAFTADYPPPLLGHKRRQIWPFSLRSHR